ncbi:MAG: exodeoxyribonuclease VII small subunit [Rickettsiales bacterium]|nr:exodeoxyribonuclease VII small subunit [Rickettsiales bacterium]
MLNKLNDDEISKLSYEDSFQYLEEIVKSLEGGEIKLEDSINIYELGIKLKLHCEKKLKASELRIKKVLDDEKLGDMT